MPTVTLNANTTPVGPNKIQVSDSDQTITWNMLPNAQAFDAQPIRFPSPPPAGYQRWPGGQVTVSGNSATTQVHKPLGVGQHETYKYSIYLANGNVIDPEVENTGSGMGGPGPRPKH